MELLSQVLKFPHEYLCPDGVRKTCGRDATGTSLQTRFNFSFFSSYCFLQGSGDIWYAGSSVVFETVRSVMEYNRLLVRQMEAPPQAGLHHMAPFTVWGRHWGSRGGARKWARHP